MRGEQRARYLLNRLYLLLLLVAVCLLFVTGARRGRCCGSSGDFYSLAKLSLKFPFIWLIVLLVEGLLVEAPQIFALTTSRGDVVGVPSAATVGGEVDRR